MFKEVLQEMVDRTEGGVAGLLMGYDGIPVEQYVNGEEAMDIETVGMEFSVILKDVRRAAEMLEVGRANEIAIRAEKMTTVIRLLNEEYFVAVTLRPDGNFGKARFMLRRGGSKLLTGLE